MDRLLSVHMEHVPEPGVFCIDVALVAKNGAKIALEEHGPHHYHLAPSWRDQRVGENGS